MDKLDALEETIRVQSENMKKRRIFMRMVTFLLGGILGACAVVYMNRNNGMMLSNITNAGQSVGNMVSKAKSKLSNMNMDMIKDTNSNNTSSNRINGHSNDDENLAKVEEIVKKDPNLKNKVDEILADNNQNTSSFRMQ
jgi:Sec-independent protein translocase protein TatA